MSQPLFLPDWVQQMSDPYAVLGLSVTADDRRLLKRYRDVAKLLHPDRFVNVDPAASTLASQILARLVNPAYQKLKQDKGRAENLAMLRFRVRRMSREEAIKPRYAASLHLVRVPPPEIDIFYEQAIAKLADSQFQPLSRFEAVTLELSELNLIYLRLKMGEPMIREKRSGLVAASQVRPVQMPVAQAMQTSDKPTIDYAARHFARAQEYARNGNWATVVRELQDAIKIDPKRSEFHALLGTAYLKQDLPTMAKVHFRQALKLNPNDQLALRYAQKLQIQLDPPPSAAHNGAKPPTNRSSNNPSSNNGLFSFFARKR